MINEEVKTATKGLIDSITEDIDTATRLIVFNASYFKGKLKIPFTTESTVDEEFTLNSGETVQTAMMFQKNFIQSSI